MVLLCFLYLSQSLFLCIYCNLISNCFLSFLSNLSMFFYHVFLFFLPPTNNYVSLPHLLILPFLIFQLKPQLSFMCICMHCKCISKNSMCDFQTLHWGTKEDRRCWIWWSGFFFLDMLSELIVKCVMRFSRFENFRRLIEMIASHQYFQCSAE
jgi:hypothetical protein